MRSWSTSSTRATRPFFAIEESPVPWVALVDGYALGGIYELALACRAIVATERSTVGFPEIRLNIFPGLGGTQRMPRRSGLVHADGSGERATQASLPCWAGATSRREQGGGDPHGGRAWFPPTRTRSPGPPSSCV